MKQRSFLSLKTIQRRVDLTFSNLDEDQRIKIALFGLSLLEVNSEARFLSLINKTPSCWIWAGSVSAKYGRFNSGASKNRLAHRYSYEFHKGKIPRGLHIDHLCRNTICVNPAHLEPVTRAENVRRAMQHRHPVQDGKCFRGHTLNGRARSKCFECTKIYRKRWEAKNPSYVSPSHKSQKAKSVR